PPAPESVPVPQPTPAPAPPCGPAPEEATPPAPAEPSAVAEMAAPDAPPAVVQPRAPHGTLSYLVLDGGDVAGSGLSIPEKVAQGLSARAYLYTDRPAYRPGHDVELRGVVREVIGGQYANVPGATYTLEIYDS